MDPISPTERLYHQDPMVAAFNAGVVAHSTWKGEAAIVLDRTAFYPESGGQGADHGVVGPARVVDVQVDSEGVVHHLIEGEPPPVGVEVRAEIDWPRRRDFMAQHTGQHLLSQAMMRVAQARTISSRLGERVCTLDVGVPELSDEQAARAESLVNGVIDDDLPVRAYFPDPGELARLELRRRPKVDHGIRVVEVGDFEVVPCGGTHCTRTGQIGLIHVMGVERYKGMTRLTFVCGARARELLIERSRVLAEVGRGLSSGPAEVPAALTALRRELDQAKETLGATRRRLADATAQELLARDSGGAVIATLEEADAALLREVGKRIIAHPGRAALLAAVAGEGTVIFAARGEACDLDCGALLRSVTKAAGGRGGGRPDHAEGRLPIGADWPTLVRGYLSASS
jgi:alanyl-tRNA synthetase